MDQLQPPSDLIDAEGPPADLIDAPQSVPFAIAPDAQPIQTDAQRSFMNSTAVGRIMSATGAGLYQPFEAGDLGLSDQSIEAFKKAGIFRQKTTDFNPIKAFNEGVVMFSAATADAAMRTLQAPFTGLAQFIGQTSEETGLATALGYYHGDHTGSQVNAVANDVLGAMETLPLVMGVHAGEFPTPGRLAIRQRNIAAQEQIRADQIPAKVAGEKLPPIEPVPIAAPEILVVAPGTVADRGLSIAMAHIERGASFDELSKAILSDLGEEARPMLQTWYEQAKAAVGEFAKSEYGGSAPKPPLTPPPPEMLGPNKAGNINLDRINAPDDVMNVIRETADHNAGFESARRGSMTYEDIQNLADAAGMDPRKLAKRGVGRAFNAEEAVALRDYLVASAGKVQDLARSVQGGSDEALLDFEKALTRHVAIQERVAGMTAEAGRALSSFNIKAEATEKTKALAQLLEAQGGRATIEEKAAAIRSLNDPEAISRTIAGMRKATKLEMVVEAWINGLLSGPMTHATNVVSNSLTNVMNISETALAAVVGTARESLGVGVGEEKIALGEARARAFAMVQGAKESVIASGKAFAEDSVGGKLEGRRAIPGTAGQIIRTPGRLLTAEDAFFKSMSKRQEISALAYRNATAEGLSGRQLAARIAELKAAPTDEMLEAASKTADYLTFTKPLGKTGKAVQAFFNSHPALKFIVPFTRTPANILKYGGERTPFGLFSKQVRANLSGENGRVAQDMQIARMTIGSAVTVATFMMASDGTITGGGPRDPSARALLYMTGWQPYSVRVGDTYYSYLRVGGPYGVMMGIAADANEISHDVSAAQADQLGRLVFASATQNLLNQTWLQGPADLMQAVTDTDRYGTPWVRGLASSFVPAGVAQAARANDPYLREARSILDGFKARIPVWSETLMPRIDLWGNEIKREGSLGPDIVSPIYLTQVKNDAVAREMLRLGIWKTQPDRKIRGVELDDAQYVDFQRTAGRLTHQALSQVIGSEGWGEIPAASQAEIINRVFDRTRESARSFMMVQHPDLLNAIVRQRIDEVTGPPKKSGLVPYPAMPQ